MLRTRAVLATLGMLALLAALASFGCAKKSATAPAPVAAGTRRFRMGFSPLPPKADQALAVLALQTWASRADAAILHSDVPWDSLLAGADPARLVSVDPLPITQFWRAKGLKLWFEADPTNGLDRAADAPALVARGLSITSPAVRALYIAYVCAVDSIVHPDYIGLGSETNLVRVAAPDSLYQAERILANACADTLAARHARMPGILGGLPKLYTSVQVETAWGRLGNGGSYVGVAQDVADFPFTDVVGLSSYPYLGGFTNPEDMPDDYYARVAHDLGKPVMVVEGGWASANVGAVVTSPAKQARYVRRMATLLEAAGAVAFLQLEFADLDLAAIAPLPPGSIIPEFATIGVADSALGPKPALGAWDSLFARTLVP